MEIINVAVHHFAGNLSLYQVNALHRSEWPDSPSELRPDLYVGYNFIIWKDGSWLQTRYIGEETCAQKGHNFDTVSICLAGDFTAAKPSFSQQKTLVWMVENLVEGRGIEVGVKIKPGTVIKIPQTNIYPHRVLQPHHTDCYGKALSDNWARDLCFPKTTPVIFATSTPDVSNGPEWTKLMQSWQEVLKLWNKISGQKLGGQRMCIADVRN